MRKVSYISLRQLPPRLVRVLLVCERLIPYGQADFSGLDPEEIAYRLALAIAMTSKRGFRLKDL